MLVYGDENPDLLPSNLPQHVRACLVKSKFPFGKHHTKMMIFVYDDESVRVVVSTANLIGSDWENRTQGLWIGPRCPKITNSSDGDSATGFKTDLLRYLRHYSLSPMKEYVRAVEACDFSTVKVFFLGSVPDSHKGANISSWGHRQLASLLFRHLGGCATNWPLVIQCSSIGSLGPTEHHWLKGELGQSMSTSSKLSSNVAPIAVIYPSKQDVFKSYDGIFGGGCLPYSKQTHLKQPWLDALLHSWRADTTYRSRAMPHIKTYARISPDGSKAAFFALTSANLSKAAWGVLSKAKTSFQIQSYEAGVLLLPKFLVDAEHFEVGRQLTLPYDLPLTKYTKENSVWLMDYLRELVM